MAAVRSKVQQACGEGQLEGKWLRGFGAKPPFPLQTARCVTPRDAYLCRACRLAIGAAAH